MARVGAYVGWVMVTALLVGCDGQAAQPDDPALVPAPEAALVDSGRTAAPARDPAPTREGPRGTVRLAFAGDTHFELHLARLLDHPRRGLGPIDRTLAAADLTMVNLESAITSRGTPERKEREDPGQRYHFRTSPAALDVLAAAGVDVVTMANNHGADYGPVGVRDTLRAKRKGPVPVVGIGADRRAAFRPYRAAVRGTTFAFFGADASFREGASSVWAAGPTNAGIAAAHADRPRALVSAVRRASRQDDVVVVYLHWGEELQECPTTKQQVTARALAAAGADIVVGSHAHVLLGSGWMGDTYVNYGLGNFLWYHDAQPDSGVLGIRIKDGEVVDDSWTPARIGPDGRPRALRGDAAETASGQWRRLRGCAGLAPRPDRLPDYAASVRPIGPDLRAEMRSSHRPGCPVALADLRHLKLRYVGFDGAARTGAMIVHREQARGVVRVFRRLYDARWPIRRMRLVDEYKGSDRLSMAANNTSGYNCRRVAGQDFWSDHAYGNAIDINPVQNPDLTAPSVGPPAGARFATIDRSAFARPVPGAIRRNDVVVRAFAAIGWEWGGDWAAPDYQHFAASER